MAPPECVEWRKIPQRKIKTLLSKKKKEEEEERDNAQSQTICHMVVTVVTAVPQRETLLWEGSGENQGSGRK